MAGGKQAPETVCGFWGETVDYTIARMQSLGRLKGVCTLVLKSETILRRRSFCRLALAAGRSPIQRYDDDDDDAQRLKDELKVSDGTKSRLNKLPAGIGLTS